tara:strand:+ start:32 stop:532 length:501 start_codon:yes stop_codon:yes gene_type:complete
MSGIAGNLESKNGIVGNPDGSYIFLGQKDSFTGAEDTHHLLSTDTRYDPLGGWDTSAHKYTVKGSGWYIFSCFWESYDSGNNTGGIMTQLKKNGSTIYEKYNYVKYSGSGWVYDSMRHFGAESSCPYNASAGDYFQYYLWFKTGNGSDNYMSHPFITIYKADKSGI